MKVRQFIVNNKEIIVRSIFVFLVLAITVFGLTFAWYSFTNPNIDVAGNTSSWCDGLDVTASGGTITNANLGSPKAAYNSNGATANTTFSITNNENSTVVVDISITNINMDSALKNEYFMYTLTEGNTVISEGNFSDVSSISGGFIVVKQNLSLSASTTKNYSLYLWIKNNGGNQNDMQNKTFSGNMKMNFSSSFCNASNNNISLDSLYYNITKDAIIDNVKSKYVSSNKGIDFTSNSSDTNGKGIYIRAGTENDSHPIYYYRGAVNNNNVLFANFCWKIVRTTDTGGIKLIYNGTPTDGKCTNTTGDNTQLSTTSKFNTSYNSPTYVGYMYGTPYPYTNKSMSSDTNSYIYGNSVTYNNGTYTLTNTITGTYSSLYNGGLNNNHYTCFTTSNTCTNVYYIYYTVSSAAYYITLSNGEKVEDALSEMLDYNTTDSTIKTNIDNWYNSNMTSYTNNYLEDTIYCNDRSISQKNGWDPNGGSTRSYLYFGANERSSNPIVTCPRDIDKFTVSSGIGNGKLSYPVGLLTEDEARLAGGSSSSNRSYYLYTNKYYWLASPDNFNLNYAYEYYVYSSGFLSSANVDDARGVRPVVSLKPGTKIKSGNGTSDEPYKVE